MKKLKKPRASSIVIASVSIAAIFALVLLLVWLPRKHEARVPAPPKRTPKGQMAKKVGAKSAAGFSSRRRASHEAIRCLQALCDTGASDLALAETHDLMVKLDASSPRAAQGLSALLRSILAYREGSGGDSHAQFSAVSHFAIPKDLFDRAAAACDARSRRRPDEIVLSFAGDCTFGTVNGDDSALRFPSVYRRSGRFNYPFALVQPWFLNDDLTVVNFECTLTNAVKTADKQWKFKGDAKYAAIFPAGSVEAVGLSNNHAFDYRQSGFHDTVTNFEKAHIPVFYQNVPYRTMVHGVEVVLIGDCTVIGENTTMIGKTPERVLEQIKRYKRPGNIVIVVMHWGSELDTVPRPWQQRLGRQFIDAGADAVVGHHPHVVQGIENYKGKYIAYSLGNFAFGGNSLARYPETFVLRLRFHAAAGRIRVLTASLVPCWVTSRQARNAANILRNNYQPRPVFGKPAQRAINLVLGRSAGLKYGVKSLEYLRLQ